MTPEVMPMMYRASHAGIEVLRYLNEPISMKREAVPRNEIPRAIKTLPTMLMVRSLFRRFLNAVSASFTYSLRIAFISFRNAAIISLNDIFSVIQSLRLFQKKNQSISKIGATVFQNPHTKFILKSYFKIVTANTVPLLLSRYSHICLSLNSLIECLGVNIEQEKASSAPHIRCAFISRDTSEWNTTKQCSLSRLRQNLQKSLGNAETQRYDAP